MKRWMIVTALSALALGISAPAQAQEPYVGVGLGAFNIDNGINKKAAFGGYLQLGDDFSEYVGGEVRVGGSGQSGATAFGAKSKVDWFVAAFAKPKIELYDNFTVYGLIGLASVRGSYSAPGIATRKKTRTGLGYGLGFDYRTADQFSVGAEWSHLLTKPNNTAATINNNFGGVSTSIYTVSAKYHF